MESGLSWYSEDGKVSHKLESCSYNTGSLKTEAPSKWRKKPPIFSEDSGCKGEFKKPQSLGQPGSFKKGRNPPVGVTSPITHTSQSMLRVAGELSSIFSLFICFFFVFFSLFILFRDLVYRVRWGNHCHQLSLVWWSPVSNRLFIEQPSQIAAWCQNDCRSLPF